MSDASHTGDNILAGSPPASTMAAMMTGSVAHDEFGIPLDTIRMDALAAAGLIFAGIACGSLLARKK